jgi:hypothetical protein
MNVLGIDPGLRCTGAAQYLNGVWNIQSIYTKCNEYENRVNEILGKIPPYPAGDSAWDIVVIEKPQVYQLKYSKGDPNGLVSLAMLVGSISAAVVAKTKLFPLPRTWKGQIPKEIHHRRIARAIGITKKISKDAYDAAGLALYGLEVLGGNK